jgi:hypothetical protein
MPAAATEVSTTGLVDNKRNSDEPKGRQWHEALNVGSCRGAGSGLSVSAVARRHVVNAEKCRFAAPARGSLDSGTIFTGSVVTLSSAAGGCPGLHVTTLYEQEIKFACSARDSPRGID